MLLQYLNNAHLVVSSRICCVIAYRTLSSGQLCSPSHFMFRVTEENGELVEGTENSILLVYLLLPIIVLHFMKKEFS